MTKNETDHIVLTCTMEGKPFPLVNWIKDGNLINVDADSRKTLVTSGNVTSVVSSLHINNLKNTDNGGYKCTASNTEMKGVESSTAYLTVNCKYRKPWVTC